MKPHPQDYQKVARHEITKQSQREFLPRLSQNNSLRCSTAMNLFGDPEAQESARQIAGKIRKNSLDALPELLEEFELNATKNGIKVLWAEDGNEATQIIIELAKKHDAKIVTKGKSIISEEINLNHSLEHEGIKVYEGDLGEFIVQQRGTPPFHIVGPAINLTVPEIAEVLHKQIGMPYSEAPLEMAGYVRRFLRSQFEKVDIGITGVNQAIASTGSVVLVENEGNIRWSTTSPRIQISLMSIEKVVSSFEDGLYLLSLLTSNCTGQIMTSYVSVINGPRRPEEADGPEEVYVIIIDNGRSNAYQDPKLREAFRCIRCGRCMWKCPVWLRVGAYPYGWCYSGPISKVLSPLLLGLDQTRDIYETCTLCGACQEVCPVKVPHTDIIEYYREIKSSGSKILSATPSSWIEKSAFGLWEQAITNPRLYANGLGVIKRVMNLFAKNGFIKYLPGPMQGWFTCRDLPQPPALSFHQKWKQGIINKVFEPVMPRPITSNKDRGGDLNYEQ